MADLKIDIEGIEGLEKGHYVVLDGEIGPAGAPVFSSKLQSVVSAGAVAVLLDLTKVSYMNSTALAALIKLEDQLEKGYLGLVGIQNSARIVMDNLGITGLFHVHETRDEAVKAALEQSGKKRETKVRAEPPKPDPEKEKATLNRTQAWMLFYPVISYAGTVQPGKQLILTFSLKRDAPDPGVITGGVRLKDLPADWSEAAVVVRVTSDHLEFDAGGDEGVILLRRDENNVRSTLVARIPPDAKLGKTIRVDTKYLTAGASRGSACREIPVT